MSLDTSALLKLQAILADFSKVERNHFIPGTEKRENDSEHTLSVSMLCWAIISKHSLALNLEKVLTYALVHDLVEVYAGDVNTYASTEQREQKVANERKALEKLRLTLADFPDILHAIEGYEERIDDESLFVWTVDKMQAYLLGDIDAWRPYRMLDISYERFCEKSTELLAQASPYAENIFQELFAYAKTTYYDQPNHK